MEPQHLAPHLDHTGPLHEIHSILVVFMPMVKRLGEYLQMSKNYWVKFQMSKAYVDPWDIVNNFCFHVYVKCQLSNVKKKRSIFNMAQK